mgnify:CR=1 FL=1|tara:strand:+ start:3479 stop:3721 length:243 start_codon:yes stop_codon:yes gene_type:complete
MGDTTRVYLINRSLTEDCRVFTTLKGMCEIINSEFREKGYDQLSLQSKLFSYEAVRSLGLSNYQPQKYKGYTIRRKNIER